MFADLFAQVVWVCILQCLAVGGWFESVSQREIVFRLCLLFPIRGQYANSRCQPSCCVLAWCLHCVTLATNHAALLPPLYQAGTDRARNLATPWLQQSGSLARVRSDKIPLRWIFSHTEDGAKRIKWPYERLYLMITPNKMSEALAYCVAGEARLYFLLQLLHISERFTHTRALT